MTSAKKRTLERLNENPEKLMDVLKRLGGLRVSILLPISTKPPESDQNVVRLKELYRRGIDLLTENGLNREGAELILQPVEALLENPKSLLRPAETLVFFFDEDSASLVEVPYRIESQVAVGNRFVLKPLLPLLQHDSAFTIACLNRGQVTVYKGTRLGIREVKVPDMPTTLQDVVKFDDPEKSLQHHTAKSGAAKGRSGSSPVPAMHGQGLPSDLEKSQNERFFREVANAVRKYLANDRSPLVLFGVDENIGLFNSATDWGDQEILSVHQDPQEWSKADILRHATDLLMPYWEGKISEKVERLEEACGKDSAIIDTSKCVLAAAHGRVEMACVASDRTEPGICQPEKMQVKFVEADDAGCVLDLLDTIAFETIKHGGEAFTLPTDKVPGPGNTAATVRFEVR